MKPLIGIDLDGTIEDSRDDMVTAAQRVRATLSLPVRAASELRPHVNAGMDQLYRACFNDYLSAAGGGSESTRYAQVREAYEADYLAHVAVETRLYGGMEGALHELAHMGHLVCVTNKPEHISRHLLRALAVGELFSTVVGGDSCPQIKPHPIMLQTAAVRCGLDRAHPLSCMIGDTQADVQLGRAFGARTIWCAWGYVSALAEAADFAANTPAELPSLVARCFAG